MFSDHGFNFPSSQGITLNDKIILMGVEIEIKKKEGRGLQACFTMKMQSFYLSKLSFCYVLGNCIRAFNRKLLLFVQAIEHYFYYYLDN